MLSSNCCGGVLLHVSVCYRAYELVPTSDFKLSRFAFSLLAAPTLSNVIVQKKLRRRVEKRLDEARGERRERRERLLQIKHEQSELTEKDDWEG
jgi:hypothetical protein